MIEMIGRDIGDEARVHGVAEAKPQPRAILLRPGAAANFAQMIGPVALHPADRRRGTAPARRVDPAARHQPLAVCQLNRAAHRRPLVELDAGGDIRRGMDRPIVERDRNGIEIGKEQHPPHAGNSARVDGNGKGTLILRNGGKFDLHSCVEADGIIAEQGLGVRAPHGRSQRISGIILRRQPRRGDQRQQQRHHGLHVPSP